MIGQILRRSENSSLYHVWFRAAVSPTFQDRLPATARNTDAPNAVSIMLASITTRPSLAECNSGAPAQLLGSIFVLCWRIVGGGWRVARPLD